MQNDVNNNQEAKKTKDKKTSFFKKVLISIKDFDKYDMFARENVGQAIIYLLQMMVAFSILITVLSVYSFSNNLRDIITKFDEQISSLSYSDGSLTINDNQKLEVNDFNETIGKVIIDTSDLTDEQIEQYKKEIQDNGNGVLLIKDKVIILNESLSAIAESNYKSILDSYQIETLDKQLILDYYNKNNISIYISAAILMFVYIFMIYSFNILIDSVALGILAFITARIVRIKMKYTASLNISIHALTLPLLLNMIYVLINFFTGYTVKYFQIMYTTIAYIYIITAILMIKSDYIKGQMEVQKIEDEQQKIKEEIKEKEAEDKARKEKEDVDKKERESEENDKLKKEKKEKKPTPRIGNKPEGDNA